MEHDLRYSPRNSRRELVRVSQIYNIQIHPTMDSSLRSTQDTNPLLDIAGSPRCSELEINRIRPAVDAVLENNRRTISQIEQHDENVTWNNFVSVLEDIEDRLDRVWSPVSHLNGVRDSDELRSVYEGCISKLSSYYTDVGQNEVLYRKFQAISETPEFEKLHTAQRKVIENTLRDFRLSGVELDARPKARFKQISEQLSSLGNRFNQNVLDATDSWSMILTSVDEVSGLPQSALEMARHEAQAVEEEGWRFSLKAPSYIPFLTYADNSDLRRRMYEAFVTRASETGPDGGRFDNGETMLEMLKLRQEKAQLLGFENYAEYSLETKMAESVAKVERFLLDLAARSLPAARCELEELKQFAAKVYGVQSLEAWDLAYYSEKLKQNKHDISQEQLRPWFPLPTVLNGMFQVVNRLFGITVKPASGAQVWHSDVRFFEIVDQNGELRGQFFIDLFARERKRGGAWMAECVNRRLTDLGIQTPVAFLTCNFTPPVGDRPPLLTHEEVTTLFHEFGHGLHHMLSRVDYSGVSGIHGVAWDAVELPSQFLENWCWEADALDMISGHYESGEPLPAEMLAKLKAGKNFQAAMQMVRQLEFSLFDLRLHSVFAPSSGCSIQSVLDQVRDEVAVVVPPEFNRFPNAFSHIFGGGYAAGYYSYKWAEVLSADAFGMFEENGIFDAGTGQAFMLSILEKGGSRDALELFRAFRGRAPDVVPLLRQSGLIAG